MTSQNINAPSRDENLMNKTDKQKQYDHKSKSDMSSEGGVNPTPEGGVNAKPERDIKHSESNQPVKKVQNRWRF